MAKRSKKLVSAEQYAEGDDSERERSEGFPIVGIGASAGGLEAVSELLHALPADARTALVIVQHLDPSHRSVLADILARTTPLPVEEVRDHVQVEPGRVYVIPPGQTMEIRDGALQLSPRLVGSQQHRPIDLFLRSLAEDLGHAAVGVILSGMATDGTLGLGAIKAAGGITLAQDESAQHTGMPRSAIAAGCVDLVLPPAEIARELVRIASHPYAASSNDQVAQLARDPALARVLEELHAGLGVDFSHYKRNTLHRRIVRRVVLHKLSSLEEYARFLHENPAEVEALYQDVLINVTSFFRNPEAFDVLKTRVLPELVKERSRHEPVRIWVLGCSTGEEAYSIAITWAEFAESIGRPISVQIFATDLNGTAIERARAGTYAKGIVQDVSPERLRRFFVEVDGTYRVTKSIRDVCVFARHNVLAEPPFSRMDLVTCRNLLIYLDATAQQRIVPALHYALRPHGCLWLGTSETIGPYRDLFEIIDVRNKLYAKKPAPVRLPLHLAPGAAAMETRHGPAPTRPREVAPAGLEAQKEADRILLARYAPASVLVDAELEILHFRGDTSPYLSPAPGRASLNLLKMLREGLLVPVRGAVHRARREEGPVREEGLRVKSNGGYRDLEVSVIPVHSQPGAAPTFLVLFEERGGPTLEQHEPPPMPIAVGRSDEPAESTIPRLQQELAATREYLQSVIAQQEAANEELQSANEEVQSTNEELQSINEELETSKEEIQSSNEELATVNEELHNRNLELSQSNNDLQNLLASVQMAIVMLGPDLRIRRFTPAAEKLLSLIPTDVGRPISDIKTQIDAPELDQMLAEVIDTVSVKECEVRDKKGRWYSLRVRPYRTLENKIDGAVIVLVDVDALKRSQEVLRRQSELLEQAHEPILMWDYDGTITYWNRCATVVYGHSRDHALGRQVHELLSPSVDPRTYKAALERDGSWSGEIEYSTRDGARVVVEARMVLVEEPDGARTVLETNSPVTERKALEAALRRRAEDLVEADRSKDEFLAVLAHELRNPLGPMHNAARVLRHPDTDPQVAARAREMIERHVAYLSRMIDDLLDVSRVTRGKVRLKRSIVDLREPLQRAVETHQASIASRSQSLALELPSEPVWVDGDAVRLEQVFGNLLANASKFTPPGGHVRVLFEEPEAGDRAGPADARDVVVCVTDDGIGIEPDMQTRIFDMFVQADQSVDRAQGGLGIGLTLVRRLVEAHGGQVVAHSDGVGRGSVFRVRLPRSTRSARRQSRDAKPATRRAAAPKGKARRVLVVDDSVDGAESLAILLRLSGHEVETAFDGHAALAAARSFRPDVVVLDLGLPGLDGFSVAREMRAIPGLERVLLIAVTGYGREEDRARARDAGFDHHLIKPVDHDELARRIAGAGG